MRGRVGRKAAPRRTTTEAPTTFRGGDAPDDTNWFRTQRRLVARLRESARVYQHQGRQALAEAAANAAEEQDALVREERRRRTQRIAAWRQAMREETAARHRWLRRPRRPMEMAVQGPLGTTEQDAGAIEQHDGVLAPDVGATARATPGGTQCTGAAPGPGTAAGDLATTHGWAGPRGRTSDAEEGARGRLLDGR